MTPEQELADVSRLSRLSFNVAAVVMGGLGALLVVAWMTVLIPTLVFVARARSAEGVYVGSVAHVGGSHGGTFLRPQFRFVTAEGRKVIFTSRGGSTNQPFNDGQKVRVLYVPAAPTIARRESFFDLWFSSAFLGLFTAVALGMAYGFTRAARRA